MIIFKTNPLYVIDLYDNRTTVGKITQYKKWYPKEIYLWDKKIAGEVFRRKYIFPTECNLIFKAWTLASFK